jgi:hypothetical protein
MCSDHTALPRQYWPSRGADLLLVHGVVALCLTVGLAPFHFVANAAAAICTWQMPPQQYVLTIVDFAFACNHLIQSGKLRVSQIARVDRSCRWRERCRRLLLDKPAPRFTYY